MLKLKQIRNAGAGETLRRLRFGTLLRDTGGAFTLTDIMGNSGRSFHWRWVAVGVAVVSVGLATVFILRWWKPKPPTVLESGFPDNGYRMLNAPSADGGPGSLQGEDEHQSLWSIAVLKLTLEPHPIAVPELQETRIVSMKVSDLLGLFGSSTSDLQQPAEADVRETFSFALINPQKVVITDSDLEGPLLDAWPEPGKRLFDYKKYLVVQEGIRADGIRLTLSRGSHLKAALDANAHLVSTTPSTQPTELVKLEPSGSDEYRLEGRFPEPLFVFVKAHELNDSRVSQLKSVFAVSVSGEIETPSVQPGSEVTTTTHGPPVTLTQRNGPLGPAKSVSGHAELVVPRGATVIASRAYWTANGRESGQSHAIVAQQGSMLVASGKLLSGGDLWGPRASGELNLAVTYRLPPTTAPTTAPTKTELTTLVKRDVVASNYTLHLPDPLPTRLTLNIQDLADGQPPVPVQITTSDGQPQTVLNGKFIVKVDASRKLLSVTRQTN